MWEDLKFQFLKGNMVVKLIFVNALIHFVISIGYIPFFLIFGQSGTGLTAAYTNFFAEWFYLPSDLSKLAVRPWTIITYMFLHAGILHLFFNMLMLYWFGRIMGDLVNDTRILPIYLLSGFVGGLLFVTAYNVFPVFNGIKPPILGASASVMGVVLATATLNPKGLFYIFLIGEVQLRYIAVVLVILDLIAIPDGNAGGRIAHIGGAIMGWYFIIALRKGLDFSKPINKTISFIRNPFKKKTTIQSPFRKEPQAAYKSQSQAYNKSSAAASSSPPMPHSQSDTNPIYNGYSKEFLREYQHLNRQGCIDAILDKIRKSGYNSINAEEKTFLDRMSEHN